MTRCSYLKLLAAMFVLSAGSILAAGTPAAANWQPSKPLQFVVMAGKGGGADKAVRFMKQIMADRSLLPVPVEVVNVPGKSGGVALAQLKSRAGDNHTVLFTLNSFYTTPLNQPALGLDIEAFTPIGRMAEDAFVLWVNVKRDEIATLQDFVAAAKAKGAGWVMAGTGKGAEDNLLTDFLNVTYGLKMTYRPMKGGGAVAKELAEGRVDSTVNNPSEQSKFHAEGLVKPIVAFTPTRLGQFARTPALRETGMEFHYFMQRSVVGPPGMDANAVRFYRSLFARLFDSPEWQSYRNKNSLRGEFLTGDALKQYWLKERQKHERWQMALEMMAPPN